MNKSDFKAHVQVIKAMIINAGFEATADKYGVIAVGLKNRNVKPIELESVLSDELDNELVRLEYLPRIGKTAVIVNV